MFIYSNNAAKLHSCGDKDLRNRFPVVVSRRDIIKTKESSQTFISEDLSLDIVLSNNCYILSQYLFFKYSKMIQLAILNFQCPGVTRITIPTRISQYVLCSLHHKYNFQFCHNLVSNSILSVVTILDQKLPQ